MILASTAQILGLKDTEAARRIPISRLLLVNLAGAFGVVLNLSESGMAVQTMLDLTAGECLSFALPLSAVEPPITGTAEVAWCDCSGRAGLRLRDLSDADAQRLRQWLGGSDAAGVARPLSPSMVRNLGTGRSSALLNAEVNCLQYHAV